MWPSNQFEFETLALKFHKKIFLFKIRAASAVDAVLVVVVPHLRNKSEREKCNSSFLALTNYDDNFSP
jgi:hypothetical protein